MCARACCAAVSSNFTAALADVQLYNVALSGDQVAGLFSGQSTAGCTVAGAGWPPAPPYPGAVASSPPPPLPPPPLPSPPAAAISVATCAGAYPAEGLSGDVTYNTGFTGTKFTYPPVSMGACVDGFNTLSSTAAAVYNGGGKCCITGKSGTPAIDWCDLGTLSGAAPAVPMIDSQTGFCLGSDGNAVSQGAMAAMGACGGTLPAVSPSRTQLFTLVSTGTKGGSTFQLKHLASGFCYYIFQAPAEGSGMGLVPCSVTGATTDTVWTWSPAGNIYLQQGAGAKLWYMTSTFQFAGYVSISISATASTKWASTCGSAAPPPASPPSPPLPPPPLPPPPPPPAVLVGITVASCAAGGNMLTGGSTVTYALSNSAVSSPATVAQGINLALSSKSSVTGLEAAGVSVDDFGGSSTLFSTATGMLCGSIAGGVLNRTGFPADAAGTPLYINRGMGSMGMPSESAPSYGAAPTTLVCSSCVSAWTPPATPACSSVAHRYSGSAAASVKTTYSVYGQTGLMSLSGSVLSITDASATLPKYPALSTPLSMAGSPVNITLVRQRLLAL